MIFVIKHYCCHSRICAKIFAELEVYLDKERLSRATVFHWYKLLTARFDSVKLLPHPGQKSIAIEEKLVNTVIAVICEDRHCLYEISVSS